VSIVAAKGVHKAYGAQVVLGSVDLSVSDGERLGVVGANGAGKSTLARILAGIDQPDGGSISRRRGARVLYLDQVPRFDGDPTAEEVVLSGLEAWTHAVERHAAVSARVAAGDGDLSALVAEQSDSAEDVERLGGWEQRHRGLAMLGKLGVTEPGQKLSRLSGGERRRVALARILIARPDLALLDEPTNHLDADTVDWLEQYLIEEHTGAVLLVTHDRYLLDRVATRTLEVAAGELFSYDGGYELYLEQKAARLAHAARTEQNRQNFLRRELEWLRRQPKARGTKQKARIERAETAIGLSAPKTELVPSFELSRARSGKTIVELHGLAVEIGGRRLITGLDLFVTEGDRIGVVGPNGSGKTTLLKVLLGQHPPAAGKVVVGANTRIAYFDQERAALADDATVYDNVIGDQPRIELAGRVVEPHSYLERFGFDRTRERQPVGSLSGGERARVALARMLRQTANLVVLDEPTNDLDVGTLSALESLLVEAGVTALVVTHDRWFLDRVATSILAFEREARVVTYPGNYSDYKVRRPAAERESVRAPRPSQPAARPAAPRKKLGFAEHRELSELPARIDEQETRIRELMSKLSNPATYAAGGHAVPEINDALAASKAELDRLMQRWEELETKKLG
jgi:ABC transport system ATP-binding/permease protein